MRRAGAEFRIHQVCQHVIDPRQMTSTLRFQPIENFWVQTDADRYLSPDFA